MHPLYVVGESSTGGFRTQQPPGMVDVMTEQSKQHPGPEIELLEGDPTVPPRPEEEVADAVRRERHGGPDPHPHHRKD
jgi:hypothetical protein